MNRRPVLIASLFLFLASCHSSTSPASGKDSSGLVTLRQSIAAHPDSPGLRLKLVDALDSSGNYSQAHAQLDSLIRRDSLNYGLWFRKGRLEQDHRDTSAAIYSFSRAVLIYPSPDALLEVANLLAERRDQRALEICNRVADLRLGREYNAHCSFIEGVYYARTSQRVQALKEFDACITDNYTYMEAYIEKGLVYFDQHDYRKGLDVFRFASQVNNLYADAYYYMARSYEMMGQKDSAIFRYRQALSLDKNMSEADTGLARLGTSR